MDIEWHVWKPHNSYYGGPDLTRCRYRVPSRDRSPLPSQCTRKAVVQECGYGWCKQHAPSALKAKGDRQKAERDAMWAKRGYERAVDEARNAIAETAIKHFRQQATFDELEAAVMAYEKLVTP
jgi:hypothetical protein